MSSRRHRCYNPGWHCAAGDSVKARWVRHHLLHQASTHSEATHLRDNWPKNRNNDTAIPCITVSAHTMYHSICTYHVSQYLHIPCITVSAHTMHHSICTYHVSQYLHIPCITVSAHIINPLIATLKPQSNRPSYSNTVIGTLAIDGWAVIFGTGTEHVSTV